MRLGGEGGDQAVALVGDAGSALGAGDVGILHGGGLSGDQGVLTIVNGVGVGEGDAQVGAAGHAAIDRERGSVVITGRRALEFVDGSELRDGPSERIDARRKWAGQRLGELPGREGIDGIVAALEDGSGGIEDGIVERGWAAGRFTSRARMRCSPRTVSSDRDMVV